MNSSDFDQANNVSLGPHESAAANGISIGSAVFAYITAKVPDAFQWRTTS